MKKLPKTQDNRLGEIESRLSKLELSDSKTHTILEKVIRRIETLQKTVDLLYQDRNIQEDIQAAIHSLKEVLLANRQHQDFAMKGLKFDVGEAEEAITEKINKVKEEVKDTKETVEQNVGELVTEISKKKILDNSFLKKITRIFRR